MSRTTFDLVQNIFQKVNKSQAVEQHNVHQLWEIRDDVDGWVKFEVSQCCFEVIDSGLDDLIGKVFVGKTDFGSEACIKMLFEWDFLDDLCEFGSDDLYCITCTFSIFY